MYSMCKARASVLALYYASERDADETGLRRKGTQTPAPGSPQILLLSGLLPSFFKKASSPLTIFWNHVSCSP